MKLFTKTMGSTKEFSRISKNNILTAEQLLIIRGGNAADEDGPITKK